MTPLSSVRDELHRRIGILAGLREPVAAVVEEPLADHVIEHVGLTVSTPLMPRYEAIFDVLADDLAERLGLLPWPGALPGAVAQLPALLRPEPFHALLADARRLLVGEHRPRLGDAADRVRRDCDLVAEMHETEWCDGDRAVVSAGGSELVVRAGRLLVGAALVAHAASDGGERTETIARRYSWRWLRDPAPEAATPRHRARTALLLRDFLACP